MVSFTNFLSFGVILICLKQPAETRRPADVEQPKVLSEAECERRLLAADRCVQKVVLIGNKTAVIPKTDYELDKYYCNPFPGNLRCLKRYEECTRLFPRTIFRLIVSNIRQTYRSVCKSDQGRAEWIKHAQCLEPSDLGLVHHIMERTTNYFEYTAENVAADENIPWFCCTWWSIIEDTSSLLHSLCDSRTGPSTADYYVDIVRSIASDAVDMVCGKYSSVKQCHQNGPQIMATMKSLPIAAKPYSVVVPVVKILHVLDSDLTSDGKPRKDRN